MAPEPPMIVSQSANQTSLRLLLFIIHPFIVARSVGGAGVVRTECRALYAARRCRMGSPLASRLDLEIICQLAGPLLRRVSDSPACWYREN